jgi:hypothetical protein
LEVVKLACENNIHIVCLIPHTTHALQPLDVAVFKCAKAEWKNIIHDYFIESRFQLVDKTNFPGLLKQLWSKAFLPHHAVAGFYKTGLFPLGPNAGQLDSIN